LSQQADEARRQVLSFADGASTSVTSNDYGVNNHVAEFEGELRLSDI